MLALFRTNQFVANFLLLFYAVIVRGVVFIRAEGVVLSQPGIFTHTVWGWIPPESTWGFILATLLVVIQGIMINLLVSKYRIAREISLLPGLFFVLLSSAFTEFLYLSPLILANTFYIIVLYELFSTYRKYNAAGAIFNIGLWIAVGSLFYFSYCFLLILGIIGLVMLRSFTFREVLMLVCGLIAPYLLTGTYYFVTDQFHVFWNIQITSSIGFLDLNGEVNWIFYIKTGLCSFLLGVLVFSYNQYTKKKSIQQQKYIDVFFLAMIAAILPFLLQANIRLDHLLILVPPAAVLISFNFQSARRGAAEAVHFLLLIGLLVLQFSFWW